MGAPVLGRVTVPVMWQCTWQFCFLLQLHYTQDLHKRGHRRREKAVSFQCAKRAHTYTSLLFTLQTYTLTQTHICAQRARR